MTVDLIQGDCLEVLKTLPDQSVQCCITSPPYYGLRDYGVEGQIGLEETPEIYVAKLVTVFREVKRALKDDGTLWLNMGDSYSGSGKGGQSEEKRSDNWQPIYANKGMTYGLKPKDLIGIPWMVAFALRADGWYLRSDIIWNKPNPMPESVRDRPTKSHEYIFLLAKAQHYYYDADAIAEEVTQSSIDRINQPNLLNQVGSARVPGKTNGNMKAVLSKNLMPDGQSPNSFHVSGANGEKDKSYPTRNKRDVWTVTTKPYKEAHFATFPPDLIEPCILAGTSEKGECPTCGKAWKRITERIGIPRNDKRDHSTEDQRQGKTPAPEPVRGENTSPIITTISWQPQCECQADPVPQTVLDPFSGAGTTGLVAIKHNRNYIGIELNPEYVEMTKKRLAEIQPVLFQE